MLPKNVATVVRKVIEANPILYLIDGTYLNPAKASQLAKNVNELAEMGLNIFETETETSSGTVVYAQIKAVSGASLPLGSITLDGTSILGKQDLVPYDDVLTFIEETAQNIQNES